ncbi:MAG: CopG family transcriptional regulator [Pseudomonadota bacterium]
MRSQRTIITLSEEDKLWLEGYSKASGISMAEAVRRALVRLKDQDGRAAYQALVNQTKGIWKMGNGLAYQKKLRSEWR